MCNENQVEFKKIDDTNFYYFSSNSDNNFLNYNEEVFKKQKITLYVFANNTNKSVNFSFKHAKNSTCKITINCIAVNGGNIDIKIKNIVPNDYTGCEIDQEINGILFDCSSQIKAKPELIVNNNKVVANHSVSIGFINKEQLFYLQSHGLDDFQAKKIILKDLFMFLGDDQFDSLIEQCN